MSKCRDVSSESSLESTESSNWWRLSIASSSSSISCCAESYSVRRRRRASYSIFICCRSESNSSCCRLISSLTLMFCVGCWELLLPSVSSSFSLANRIYTLSFYSIMGTHYLLMIMQIWLLLKSDYWVKVLRPTLTQNRLFWRRSSQPITWLGTEETKPYTSKANDKNKMAKNIQKQN